MSVITYNSSSIDTTCFKYRTKPEESCKRCYSKLIVVCDHERVCSSCGLVCGLYNPQEISRNFMFSPSSYKRIFYFNERIARWGCNEPSIEPELLALILQESKKSEYNVQNGCDRKTISKILRSIVLSEELQIKYGSCKFLKNPLSHKRFYDKYFEKWKSLRWYITGEDPIFPSPQLISRVNQLFIATQKPFELFRHANICDGRVDCPKYFNCWHNFINYDFLMRKYLQICDVRYGFNDSFETFKEEFPLVSARIRTEKLRPMWMKIAKHNSWPLIIDEE